MYFFKDPDPLPGVLGQEAGHGIKGGPAPDLAGPEPDLVHSLGQGQHILQPHAGGQQRLVAVAQGVVLDFQRSIAGENRHISLSVNRLFEFYLENKDQTYHFRPV